MILSVLEKGEASVGEIAESIDVSMTNVGQHLNI